MKDPFPTTEHQGCTKKQEITKKNSIDHLERELESQEEIFNAEFSAIKDTNNNKISPRNHG